MGTIHRKRSGTFRWEGVRIVEYADPTIRGVTKQVLIGPEDGARRFALRYFEVAPGARSALDRHAHDHGVYVLAGRGRVLLGAQTHEIGAGDVVYVEPGETHQFENTGTEPLGFLCVVALREDA